MPSNIWPSKALPDGNAPNGSMLKWLWLSILVVFVDQLTKWIAEAQIEAAKYAQKVLVENGVEKVVTVLVEPAQVIPVMPHLNWTLAYNYGAAFSLLGDHNGWQRWFFAILAIVVSLYILYWLRKLKETERWTAVALTLVLGGAVGNLIDRVLYGRVIDFIDFYIDWDVFFLHNGHFATFNVADIAITIGATLLVFISLFHKEEPREEKAGIL